MNESPLPRKKLSDEPRPMSYTSWILIGVGIIVAVILLFKFLEWFVPWFIPKVHRYHYR